MAEVKEKVVQIPDDFLTAENIKYDDEKNVKEAIDEVENKINETQTEIEENIGATLETHTTDKNNPHGVTAFHLGLDKVDNTSDMDKPVSKAQQDAIDEAYYNSNKYADQQIAEVLKTSEETIQTLETLTEAFEEHADVVDAINAAIGEKASQVELDSHLSNKNNPHGVTANQVGLGNVPNVATNDQTPTFTQASTLATLVSGEKLSVSMGKIMKAITDFISHKGSTSNPHSVTKSQVGLGNVDNTADGDKPVSTAQKTAINAVQTNLNTHTSNTSNPHSVTKSQVGLGNVPNVATNDQTPTYTVASANANLTSGEKLSVAFGKISKAVSSLITHLANTSNPHMVTKSQVGLGNVTNEAQYCASNPQPSVSGSSGSCTGNSATATKLATARTIDGVDFNGSAAISHYGTCSTAAATAAKTVALTGFKLVTGARVMVKFTVTNTASSPTLNVNSTGAKAIMYRGSAITAGYLAANRVYEFVYDGTDWELVGDINTDTNTDTKNTAGSTNSSSKLFLIGATSQAANPQTYSHDSAYIGTDGCLYSGSVKTQTITGDAKDNTVTFTSGDSTSPTAWTNVTAIATGEKLSSLFNKLSTFAKNVRYLYSMLGTTDISSIGDGTIKGAISQLAPEVLWENEDPTVNFGAQTITIDKVLNLSKETIAIDYLAGKDSAYLYRAWVYPGLDCRLEYFMQQSSTAMATRYRNVEFYAYADSIEFNFVDCKQLIITEKSTSAETKNSYVIPYRIIRYPYPINSL